MRVPWDDTSPNHFNISVACHKFVDSRHIAYLFEDFRLLIILLSENLLISSLIPALNNGCCQFKQENNFQSVDWNNPKSTKKLQHIMMSTTPLHVRRVLLLLLTYAVEHVWVLVLWSSVDWRYFGAWDQLQHFQSGQIWTNSHHCVHEFGCIMKIQMCSWGYCVASAILFHLVEILYNNLFQLFQSHNACKQLRNFHVLLIQAHVAWRQWRWRW